MKTAIYARVSTEDRQEHRNQLDELRQFARKEGYHVYDEYIDKESGATGDRPGFKKLMQAARQRKFDIVLFWSLDRFSREGVRKTINYLHELEDCGVQFKSFTERYLDSTGIFRDAIISILATLAKQERIRISERTKAGLRRAKQNGKKIGRPRLSQDKIESIRNFARENPELSTRKIGAEFGVSHTKVNELLNKGNHHPNMP